MTLLLGCLLIGHEDQAARVAAAENKEDSGETTETPAGDSAPESSGDTAVPIDSGDSASIDTAAEDSGGNDSDSSGCTICRPAIRVETGGDPYAMADFAAMVGPDARTITIHNDGDIELNVSTVYVNNDMFSTCGEFTVSGWTNATPVDPGGATSFTLTYDAVAECIELAWLSLDQNVLHILSDDPEEPDYVIELQASGF